MLFDVFNIISSAEETVNRRGAGLCSSQKHLTRPILIGVKSL